MKGSKETVEFNDIFGIKLDWDIYEDIENELVKGGQLSGDATQFNTVFCSFYVLK